MVKGLDRLNRTGIALLFVGTILVFSIGIAGTQSPEIANPFVDTFNFNTLEVVFPMLRIGDDPRRGDSTVGGTPPTGQFITCLNQIDGEFCTDILQDVNLICKLKQAVIYTFEDGTTRTLSGSDFDTFSPIIPEFSLIDPARGKIVETLTVQPRLACDVPILKDGTRVPFIVTAENGRLAIKVDAFDEFGNTQSVLTTRSITVPQTIFDDSRSPSPIDGQPLFIASERPLGQVNVGADEIENDLNPSRDFNTRVLIDLSGKLFVEVPDLNGLTNKFVVTHDLAPSAGFANPLTLNLDLLVDTEESAPTVFKTTVSTVQPDTLVVTGQSGTSSTVNVFFTMTSYTDGEGTPNCEVKETGFFGADLTTVSATKVGVINNGEDSQFSCSIGVDGATKTGTYEVKISSPSPTSAGTNRPSTTTTFIITTATDDNPLPNGDPTDPCPTVAVISQNVKDLTDESLLQQKANLLDKQARGTLSVCDGITLPLVIAEVSTRGLENDPTPPPKPPDDPTNNTCTAPKVLTKVGTNSFVCVDPSGGGGGFSLPKFIACAEGVSADTSKGEICVPPSLFSIIQWLTTGSNWIIALVSIIAILIVLKIIAVGIGKAKGGSGVVLKD